MLQKIFEGTTQEADQYLRSGSFPPNARIEIYLDDEVNSSPNIQSQQKQSLKLPPHIAKLKQTIEAHGGLSDEQARSFQENSTLFRETFDI